MMIGSRQRKGNPKNDEFYTPKFIFDALGCKFDMDVASPLNNQTNVPAAVKLTEKENGLESYWLGFVWMNPPFSKSEPWVDKFLNHSDGIALLPMSKAKWFSRVWLNADGILLLPSNFKFDKPDNQRSDIFMPTVLIGLGKKALESLINSNLGKVR
jgi:hypothetical protein